MVCEEAIVKYYLATRKAVPMDGGGSSEDEGVVILALGMVIGAEACMAAGGPDRHRH